MALMRVITLLTILLITGCSGADIEAAKDTNDYRAIAAVSFASALLTPDGSVVTPDDNDGPLPTPENCDHCRGRGYIIQGDGHRTDCPDCEPGSGSMAGTVGPMMFTAPEKVKSPECQCGDSCQCDNCQCGSQDDPPALPGPVQEVPEVVEEVVPKAIEAPPEATVTEAPKEASRQLIYFWDVWCGPCRQNEPALKRLSEEGELTVGDSEDSQIRKVQFDHNKDLARKYKITHLPTYITLVDGKEVARKVGGVMSVEGWKAQYHAGE